MPLKGSIESFGISEIFQLVDHQGKTGTLEIQTRDGLAKLRFKDGKLIEAWPDRRSPGELIGSRLVRAGIITATQLGHALDQQRENLRRLGDILTRMGAVRSSEFQEMLALQHRETVYRLLSLKRGSFQFLPGSIEMEEGVSLPLDVGTLLMEGFRQIDEWPGLLRRIPSEKTVYARVAGAAVPADLSTEAQRVLGLVDGTRTVRELVDLSRRCEFDGWQLLAEVFDLGLVTPVGAARAPKPVPRPVRSGRIADWVAGLVLMAAAAAIVVSVPSKGEEALGRWPEIRQGAIKDALEYHRAVDRWNARRPTSIPEFPLQ